MQITRCQDQKSRTLDEFYAEIGRHDGSVDREIGDALLSLLARLRALPDDRAVYGLTSHYHLGFHAEDNYQSPCFVVIRALDRRNYFIEYRMPERMAPWPHAYVKGTARSEEDAVRMILTAMEKSEGWSLT
jgi:class 3 adenylate cyclase